MAGTGHAEKANFVKRGKWTLGSKIGQGTFGTVHMCMTEAGTLMAAKEIPADKLAVDDIRREIELLKYLDHPNIVAYRGSEVKGSKLYIFQEWIPGGSVTGLLHKFGPFSTAVVRVYLKQVLLGLAFLHSQKILHRDIKGRSVYNQVMYELYLASLFHHLGSNILVNDQGIVKLADFGASKKLSEHQRGMMMTMTMRGTPYFMAPEVFEEKYGTCLAVIPLSSVVTASVSPCALTRASLHRI